jgi:uncharacterized membrane protein (UPF0127 family)
VSMGLTLFGCGVDGDGDEVVRVPTSLELLGTVSLRVRPASSTRVFDGCVYVADEESERARGLMGVTDLQDRDGMIFRYPAAHRGAFYMYRTQLALSIAFVGPAGTVVSTADMAPCLSESATGCPLTQAGSDYIDAIEMPQGALGASGLIPGAAVSVGGPC